MYSPEPTKRTASNPPSPERNKRPASPSSPPRHNNGKSRRLAFALAELTGARSLAEASPQRFYNYTTTDCYYKSELSDLYIRVQRVLNDVFQNETALFKHNGNNYSIYFYPKSPGYDWRETGNYELKLSKIDQAGKENVLVDRFRFTRDHANEFVTLPHPEVEHFRANFVISLRLIRHLLL